jgi:hypothetical protein
MLDRSREHSPGPRRRSLLAASLALAAPAGLVRADDAEPDHFRGVITAVEGSALVLKLKGGQTARLQMTDEATVLALSKSRFTEVDLGTYVGATAYRLDEYSPIVRDSAVWLHRGYELRLIDEKLRGIALGEKKWDLTPVSIIAHGWVDDLEDRVLSIKWGPSDYDETDVEVPRDVPIHRMAFGERSLLKPGVPVFAGANKGAGGRYSLAFIFCGVADAAPAL